MAQARMKGSVGFVEDIVGLFTPGDRACMDHILPLTNWTAVRRGAREILRRLRLPQNDPGHMPIGRAWPQADIERLASWIDDGAPKARGDAYASFFRDLDAVTEYFDVYGRSQAEYLMPQVAKYFGRDTEPGRRKALNLWQDYAIIPDDDPAKAEQKRLLVQEVGHADVGAAIRAVDAVLVALMRRHLSGGASVDVEMALEAVFSFGADRLTEDRDRLSRIEALNDPADYRLQYALYHRMDSLVMWMNWMGHIECAVMLYGNQDADHSVRTTLLAALCAGYSADCVYRNRGQTRAEYYGADGADRMWRKSVLIANDFDKALAEAHHLTRLRVTMQPMEALATDRPIRFQALRAPRR